MEVFTILIMAGILGLIPAFIAQQKGRSFVLWWQYGAMLFLVALPHALIISAHPRVAAIDLSKGRQGPISVADEIAKLAALRSQGVINEDEFNSQKTLLLAKSIEPSTRLPIGISDRIASPVMGIAAIGLGLVSIVMPYFAAVFFVPAAFVCSIIAFRQGHRGFGGVGFFLAVLGLAGLVDLSQEVRDAQQNLENLQKALKILN